MLNKKFKMIIVLFLIVIEKSLLAISTETEIMTLIKIVDPIKIEVDPTQPITMTVSGNPITYSESTGEKVKLSLILPTGEVKVGHQSDWAIKKYFGEVTIALQGRLGDGKFDLELPVTDTNRATSVIEGRAYFGSYKPVPGNRDNHITISTKYLNMSPIGGYEGRADFDVVFKKKAGTVMLSKGEYKGVLRIEATYGAGGL